MDYKQGDQDYRSVRPDSASRSVRPDSANRDVDYRQSTKQQQAPPHATYEDKKSVQRSKYEDPSMPSIKITINKENDAGKPREIDFKGAIDFFDPGNHYCRLTNLNFATLAEYLTHLKSEQYLKVIS